MPEGMELGSGPDDAIEWNPEKEKLENLRLGMEQLEVSEEGFKRFIKILFDNDCSDVANGIVHVFRDVDMAKAELRQLKDEGVKEMFKDKKHSIKRVLENNNSLFKGEKFDLGNEDITRKLRKALIEFVKKELGAVA